MCCQLRNLGAAPTCVQGTTAHPDVAFHAMFGAVQLEQRTCIECRPLTFVCVAVQLQRKKCPNGASPLTLMSGNRHGHRHYRRCRRYRRRSQATVLAAPPPPLPTSCLSSSPPSPCRSLEKRRRRCPAVGRGRPLSMTAPCTAVARDHGRCRRVAVREAIRRGRHLVGQYVTATPPPLSRI